MHACTHSRSHLGRFPHFDGNTTTCARAHTASSSVTFTPALCALPLPAGGMRWGDGSHPKPWFPRPDWGQCLLLTEKRTDVPLFPQSPVLPGCSASVTLIPSPEAGHLDSPGLLPFPVRTRGSRTPGGRCRCACPKACHELATSGMRVPDDLNQPVCPLCARLPQAAPRSEQKH